MCALGAIDDIRISAQAEASLKLDSFSDGFGPHELQNGDVTITGGSVAIGDVSVKSNGELSAEGTVSDDGTIQPGAISVSGNAEDSTFRPSPAENQPPINDPLASIPLPDPTVVTPKSNTDPCGTGSEHGPGVYGDVHFEADCVLEPGLYVVTGSWELTGNDDLSATGVTLYFTCGTQVSSRPCDPPGELGGELPRQRGDHDHRADRGLRRSGDRLRLAQHQPAVAHWQR